MPPEQVSEVTPSADPLVSKAQEMTAEVGKKFARIMSGDGGEGPSATTPESKPAAPTPKPASEPAKPAAAIAPAGQEPWDDPSIPEDERPPSGASKASKENWWKYKAKKDGELKSERAEREKLAKEIEALKKSPPVAGIPASEHERLKAEKAELEAIVERTSLANSPRFKQHYDGQMDKEWKFIRETAGSHAAEIEKLLKGANSPENRARLREVLDELGGMDGDLIRESYGKIRRLGLEREEQLSNHAQNMKLLKDREAAEALENNSRTLATRKAATDVLLEQAKVLPEFKADPSDASHSAFAREALEFIRQASMGELESSDAALLPVAAMKAQYYETIAMPAKDAKIAMLEEKIAKLTGAQPRVNGQTQPAKTTPNNKSKLSRETYDPMAAVREIQEKFTNVMSGQ